MSAAQGRQGAQHGVDALARLEPRQRGDHRPAPGDHGVNFGARFERRVGQRRDRRIDDDDFRPDPLHERGDEARGIVRACDDRTRAPQRRVDPARFCRRRVEREFRAMRQHGDRRGASRHSGDAFPGIGEQAEHPTVPLGECDGAPLHEAAQRPDRAEPMNRIGAAELVHSFGAHMVGEHFDIESGERQMVGKPGHQHFNAADIGAEALRRKSDQRRRLSSPAGTRQPPTPGKRPFAPSAAGHWRDENLKPTGPDR